jgi:multicomponent Na+:H+ antiporter subunit B
MSMIEIIDIVLFALLAVTAVAMLRLHDLFAIVMLSGIYSLISAALFTNMDAVDVAFTEAAVGAGISTVLMLGTLALTTSKEKVVKTQSLLPLVLVLLTGAALIYGTVDMPNFGDIASPVNSRVTDVTSVLASYRGYDTMGETTVIFTAAIAVLLLLGRTKDGISKGSRDGGTPADGAPRPLPKTARRPSTKPEDEE